ncbi:Putative glycoside hydrolase family 27/36, glycoside hydrolase, family 27, aldolase-type TIM barrel [Septoria linicola]|uniref:Alpha-galactosidase n=1 Tax=Septoria linicola TaxID=215465 RepID=A0A9Q9B4S0_9PEZI|nr:putative glycoside hydrolase family 27/36, glycoside hydrolase, family 27, aldolase-type TIM barrel [Septoria linicola]USW57478.1 Putative glycoside hydrolase family 27/36, glycoside hydrolase, family 27, aldolase-type TIM barrel [Septoria linicola]
MSRILLTSVLATLPVVRAIERFDGVGKLPALGWNSWNAYFCDVDEAKILLAANAMVDLGFKDAGYNYVVLDDCWAVKDGRDPVTNRIMPDTAKFPDGMKGLADKVHALGLKYGIEQYDNCYPTAESLDDCVACNADPDFDRIGKINGSCTAETPQTRFFQWPETRPFCANDFPEDGVDYSTSKTAGRYNAMRDALASQNRTILYSLCNWGQNQVWTWGNETGSSWRTTNDIGFGNPDWNRVTEILNVDSFLSDYTDFWGRNDPDMLEIGNGFSPAEGGTHFGLWAIMKGPLLIGTDLTKLNAEQIGLLQNSYLLAFNQDPIIGKPAKPYKWGINADWTFNSTVPAMFWSGASSEGTIVATFSPLAEAKDLEAVWADIPELNGDKYNVVDVWTSENLGCQERSVTNNVASHDTAIYLVTGAC